MNNTPYKNYNNLTNSTIQEMNKIINFDSIQKSLKQLKVTHTDEDYHKQLSNMKSQAVKFIEELDKELNNEKKKMQLKRNFLAPINLSVSDDEEEEVGNTSFHCSSTKNSESSPCWNSLSASGCRLKSKKSISKNSHLSDSKIMCHCPYCEGTAAIDCKSLCFSKKSYTNLDDDEEDEDNALYELLAQRYE